MGAQRLGGRGQHKVRVGQADALGLPLPEKVAAQLKRIAYRGVNGSVAYHPVWQSAIPYPDLSSDPSLGMPHLFFQIKDWEKQERILISPPPYNTGDFFLPPWFT